MGAQIFWSLALLALFGAHVSAKKVICYYGSWAVYRSGNGTFAVSNIDPYLCTHLMYAFAGIDEQGTVSPLDPTLELPSGSDNYRKFTALKEKNPELKTILSVGGWNQGSANYSIMAASSDLRKNFINSSLNLIETYGFDGLDLDWEYPNQRDTVYNTSDIDNYSQLLKEIKEEFEQYNYTISVAVAAVNSSASQSYDIPTISQYLDFINVMTYDMYGAWDSTTGYNSPLHKPTAYSSVADADYFSVEAAIDYWLAAGAPAEKLVVGVPFYGHTFILANASNSGVYSSSSGYGFAGPYTGEAGFAGYNEFCVMLQNETDPWTVTYDTVAEVPYAVQGTNWVSFDNVQSITAKVTWALSKNITNIFTWSIETDDFLGNCGEVNALLKAMNEALGRNVTEATS